MRGHDCSDRARAIWPTYAVSRPRSATHSARERRCSETRQLACPDRTASFAGRLTRGSSDVADHLSGKDELSPHGARTVPKSIRGAAVSQEDMMKRPSLCAALAPIALAPLLAFPGGSALVDQGQLSRRSFAVSGSSVLAVSRSKLKRWALYQRGVSHNEAAGPSVRIGGSRGVAARWPLHGGRPGMDHVTPSASTTNSSSRHRSRARIGFVVSSLRRGSAARRR